ncbi:MAG: argininosuccinate lyase [Armatimonadetes bacterium]|nr:argininosuccinate lyase [Armatimonadota bacterium]
MSKLWGGRFKKATSPIVDEFNASISFDARLWRYDIEQSIAHASMLGKCGIIPLAESEKIIQGLRDLKNDIEAGKVEFDTSAEDIHMNIEKLLHERIGDVAGMLQTARSRNDQVATDVRMYVKAQIKEIDSLIREAQSAFIKVAESNIDTIMPGYTHLQHAQPVMLAHHILAYVWMLQRDRERLADCFKRTDVLPLGSAALAGTSFPIDREYTAKMLGFSRISENSMDAVAERDFAVEFLCAISILAMHISRFAEEVVIWNTSEFGFIELDDSVATGSSLMPQKKNPDVAELMRAKTGRVYGDLMALLTVLKGLPLTYNKDLQEDKERLFDASDTIVICLKVLIEFVGHLKFNTKRMSAGLEDDFSTATDIADYLVTRGVPFRTAHEITGKLVRYCLEQGKTLGNLTLEEMRRFSDKFEDSSLTWDAWSSVEKRNIPGATAPCRLKEQLEAAKKALAADLF